MRRDSAPAVLRHKQVKHVRRSKGVRESLRMGGGGGRMSVPGAADQSVPMAIDVGVRSAVVSRSRTLLGLQEIGNQLIRLAITPDRSQPDQSHAEVRGNQRLDGTFPITNVKEHGPKMAEMFCCSGSFGKNPC